MPSYLKNKKVTRNFRMTFKNSDFKPICFSKNLFYLFFSHLLITNFWAKPEDKVSTKDRLTAEILTGLSFHNFLCNSHKNICIPSKI